MEVNSWIDPYLIELNATVVFYAGVINGIVVDAYEFAVSTNDAFVRGYAEFVETVGSYADKIDPKLGAAVRKYLTDTPAEAMAIVYRYGEEAVLKLVADVAAASEDIYGNAAILAILLMENGKDIYDIVVDSDEFDDLMAEIFATKQELIDLYAEIRGLNTITDFKYQAALDKLENKLVALYTDLYELIMATADEIDPEVEDMIEDTLVALLDSVGIIGDAGYEYGAYLDGHVKAMAGELLAMFLENTLELGEVTDEVIWKYLNLLNEFLMDTTAKIDAQIWLQISILESELLELKNKLDTVAAEIRAEIEAKIAQLERQIAVLKGLIEDGIEDINDLIAAVKATISDLEDLIRMVKDELTVENLLKVLNKLKDLDAFLTDMFGEDYEALKDLLNEYALKLLDRLLAALKEASPYIDAYLYDYFYNNPEEVIDFFKTYGDEIGAITEEYGDEALLVVAYLLYTYGPDAVEYAIENPEETFETISAWYNKYGYRIWPMVEVYLDALGIEYITVDDVVAALKALYAKLEKLGAQLDPIVKGELEKLEAEIEKLQAEIKAQLEYIAGVGAEHLEAALEEIGRAHV